MTIEFFFTLFFLPAFVFQLFIVFSFLFSLFFKRK